MPAKPETETPPPVPWYHLDIDIRNDDRAAIVAQVEAILEWLEATSPAASHSVESVGPNSSASVRLTFTPPTPNPPPVENPVETEEPG